jgi:hypothetical protein
MTVRILKDKNASSYRVEWTEEDGYLRDRPFDTYRAAERYAMQIECRLLIESRLIVDDISAGTTI